MINLSAEGYGIHGTPFPGKVSKARSHGCVRLTNWDAERLAERVAKGTQVAFVDGPRSQTNEEVQLDAFNILVGDGEDLRRLRRCEEQFSLR